MSEQKKYYWLKLHDDFFTSKRIKKLRKLGSDYLIIYLKLQLLSVSNGGYLEYTGVENTFAEELALDINEDSDKVQLTLSFLQSCELLEVQNENEIFLPYVEKCTGSLTQDAQREQWRIRQQRHRDKAKLEDKKRDVTLCHENVTRDTSREIEIDIDKEKEIYKEKENVTEIAKIDNDFDYEWGFNQFFDNYPKKSAYQVGLVAYIDYMKSMVDPWGASDELYRAMREYLDDCKKKNPSEPYKYVKSFAKWLKEDSVGWIRIYRGKKNGQ